MKFYLTRFVQDSAFEKRMFWGDASTSELPSHKQ